MLAARTVCTVPIIYAGTGVIGASVLLLEERDASGQGRVRHGGKLGIWG